MKIAVIGWGSLVWDPKRLDMDPVWRKDGPDLPVEFLRVSGGNRLTLVISEGFPTQMTLWTLSRKTTLKDAAANLRSREGTIDRNIGRWCDAQAPVGHIETVIAKWAAGHHINDVVWTALGPSKPSGEDGLASSEEIIDYLKQLVATGTASAAREYVEKAPAQIETPLRIRIRKELGWQ